MGSFLNQPSLNNVLTEMRITKCTMHPLHTTNHNTRYAVVEEKREGKGKGGSFYPIQSSYRQSLTPTSEKRKHLSKSHRNRAALK